MKSMFKLTLALLLVAPLAKGMESAVAVTPVVPAASVKSCLISRVVTGAKNGIVAAAKSVKNNAGKGANFVATKTVDGAKFVGTKTAAGYNVTKALVVAHPWKSAAVVVAVAAVVAAVAVYVYGSSENPYPYFDGKVHKIRLSDGSIHYLYFSF